MSGVNYKLFHSIISAYRRGGISRGRFIREWGMAQRALGIIPAAPPRYGEAK